MMYKNLYTLFNSLVIVCTYYYRKNKLKLQHFDIWQIMNNFARSN